MVLQSCSGIDAVWKVARKVCVTVRLDFRKVINKYWMVINIPLNYNTIKYKFKHNILKCYLINEKSFFKYDKHLFAVSERKKSSSGSNSGRFLTIAVPCQKTSMILITFQ